MSFLHHTEMYQYSWFNTKVFPPMEIRQFSSQLVKQSLYDELHNRPKSVINVKEISFKKPKTVV